METGNAYVVTKMFLKKVIYELNLRLREVIQNVMNVKPFNIKKHSSKST